MRCKFLTLLFLLFTFYSQAQKLEVFNPPIAGGLGYDDLFGTNVGNANILASPSVAGMTVFVSWGAVDTAGGPCQETGTTTTCNWSNVDTQLWAYIKGTNNNGLQSHGEKLNLIVEMIPEGGTAKNTIPAYVFQPSTYASWCPSCNVNQPQDMASCGSWSGATSAPTCSGQASSPSVQACGATGSGTAIGIGVWNINTCRLTGGVTNGCPNQKEVGLDFSGYPVVYETPIMTAYQKFVDTLLKHYSSHGDVNGGGAANGPAIGAYISYIRVGLTSGGEDFPVCAQSLVNNTTTGVWPSPQGLNYDLVPIPNQNIPPDWYETTAVCPGGVNDEAACRGKYAYLLGSPNGNTTDGNGYVATMFKAFQASRSTYYGTGGPQVVANAHTGPPSLTDMSYADQEAQVIIGSTLPGCGGYCGKSGFGQESLSEYDVWTPVNGKCDDDWCALFQLYSPTYPGNYFLQTTLPNSKAVYSIQTISTTFPYLQGKVTCSSTCTNFNTSPPAFSPSGLYPQEGFAMTISGATKSYKIATNGTDGNGNAVGVLNSTQFTCDLNTPCPSANTQTLYTGDYLPDTVPFAGRTDASTIEVYFCDWEFALNSNSSQTTTGCQNYDNVYSPKYATVLDPP